ncbi:hypothetical protein CCR75_003496 [Bremia lactucae]|uniref:Kinesin-like protein n=1 Tax=Bremia lactucae TaxID=4779 RepID=A0A976FRB1_BRELC|nr:hypothetical protein CCR75_003496 [Bremia lactucae]
MVMHDHFGRSGFASLQIDPFLACENRHENTIYQQIFPAQIPSRATSDDKKTRVGTSTASSTSSALRDAASKLPSSYSFDYLYPPATHTHSVYDETVKDVVMAATEGYHSSVFLYGQTGTGKTYTMQGGRGDPGIIQLSVQDIFDHIARQPSMEFLLRVSYLEIYNERIYDLLAAGAKSDIKIYDVQPPNSTMGRHSLGPKDVVIRGLREEIVLSMEHVLSLVEVGNLHRHMATTESNDQSSRSHVVFRMVIESQAKRKSRDSDEIVPVRSATLNIIDLAGSESVRLANTSGQALEEGKYINRSLLTLGHIIWTLSRAQSSKSARLSGPLHLPYRNSKLTRILQPSLGGKAQIAIVCTASPSVECLSETHSTLKFATRARRVRNRVVVNDGVGESALLRKYRARIHELETQLKQLQNRRRPRDTTSLRARQMELQCAINNINRVILNSSQALERPRNDTSFFDAPNVVSTESDVATLSEQLPLVRSRATFQPPLQAPVLPNLEREEKRKVVESVRPRVIHSSNLNQTLSSSASATLWPLSTSSGRHVKEDDAMESKREDDEEEVKESAQEADATDSSRIRPSLTAMLKTKYVDELAKMDQRSGRWQHMEEGELYSQKELLREFVRGLEIAQAEQETRMNKIRALEVENHRLRQVVKTTGDDVKEATDVGDVDDVVARGLFTS